MSSASVGGHRDVACSRPVDLAGQLVDRCGSPGSDHFSDEASPILNNSGRSSTDAFPVLLEEGEGDGVKGSCCDRILNSERSQTAAKLCGSLSSEGDHCGVHRVGRPLETTPGNTPCQDRGLSRAGPGNDGQEGSARGHRSSLFGIEFSNEISLSERRRGRGAHLGTCTRSDHSNIVGADRPAVGGQIRADAVTSNLGLMSNKPSFLNPSFPEKLLFDEEVVVVDLKPHWWHFAQSGSAAVVAMAALIWASTWDESNFLETWGGVVLAAVFVASVLWLFLTWLKWRSTHFVVTSDRVIYRSGVLIKRGIAIPLERVNNINFHQTILERLIRAGDLQIESAGQDGQQNFSDIRRPDEVQRLIHAQIEENDLRSRNGSSGSLGVASQLEKLEGLRDRGTLTQEEFQREKDKLLGKD